MSKKTDYMHQQYANLFKGIHSWEDALKPRRKAGFHSAGTVPAKSKIKKAKRLEDLVLDQKLMGKNYRALELKVESLLRTDWLEPRQISRMVKIPSRNVRKIIEQLKDDGIVIVSRPSKLMNAIPHHPQYKIEKL